MMGRACDGMSAQAVPAVTPGRARYALGLLFTINLFNYIDRQVISGVLPLVQQDLRLSDTALGWLAYTSGEGALGRKMAEIAGTYLEIVGRLAGEIPRPPGSPPADVAVLPVLGLAAAVALERRMLSERRLTREKALELTRYVVRRLLGPEEAR